VAIDAIGNLKGISSKVLIQTLREIYNEYYGAAEPPVRGGASHLSGQTEPPKNHFPSEMDLIP